MAGIDLLEIGDARIAAQLLVQLAEANVNARRAGGAGLKRTVGETAGRGTDVEQVCAVEVDGKFLEVGRQLFAAAADEAGRLVDCQLEVRSVFLARFLESLGAV